MFHWNAPSDFIPKYPHLPMYMMSEWSWLQYQSRSRVRKEACENLRLSNIVWNLKVDAQNVLQCLYYSCCVIELTRREEKTEEASVTTWNNIQYIRYNCVICIDMSMDFIACLFCFVQLWNNFECCCFSYISSLWCGYSTKNESLSISCSYVPRLVSTCIRMRLIRFDCEQFCHLAGVIVLLEFNELKFLGTTFLAAAKTCRNGAKNWRENARKNLCFCRRNTVQRRRKKGTEYICASELNQLLVLSPHWFDEDDRIVSFPIQINSTNMDFRPTLYSMLQKQQKHNYVVNERISISWI